MNKDGVTGGPGTASAETSGLLSASPFPKDGVRSLAP